MRVAGVYCGALKAPLFYGSAFKTDFTVFPFVDLTGRHTVANTAVTQSSGRAFFGSSRDSFLAATGLLKDYELQRDFDLILTFNAATAGNGYIAAIHQNSLGFPQSNVAIFLTAAGVLQLIVGSSYQTVSSASGAIVAGTDYTVRIYRRGNAFKAFLNFTLLGTITEILPVLLRVLTIGGINAFANNGFHGTIDNVDFKLLKTLCALYFESFPFVEDAGRHTVSNFGVTQSGGSAYFNNPSDSSLARLEVLGNQDDFNLQNDFDISFTANVASFSGRSDQILFSIENDSVTSVVECYIKNTGQIYLNFPSATFITSTGIIGAATSYNIRIERRGTSAQIWVNDIARAIVTPSIPAILNVPRKLVLGASARTGINGFGINGTIDNFKFDVC